MKKNPKNGFHFLYVGWNVSWTCFHDIYPVGSPVWFCNFPSAAHRHRNQEQHRHMTSQWISVQHRATNQHERWARRQSTLGKEKERARGCRLVGSCVSVWCILLLCVGWISCKGLSWILFSSHCLSVVTHSTHFCLVV